VYIRRDTRDVSKLPIFLNNSKVSCFVRQGIYRSYWRQTWQVWQKSTNYEM